MIVREGERAYRRDQRRCKHSGRPRPREVAYRSVWRCPGCQRRFTATFRTVDVACWPRPAWRRRRWLLPR